MWCPDFIARRLRAIRHMVPIESVKEITQGKHVRIVLSILGPNVVILMIFWHAKQMGIH